MRYLALCCDYDGTLATDGRLLPETVRSLEHFLASGRRLVMVTGRELDDLKRVCERLDLFQYVVAENGALLYDPGTGAETLLAERPPERFLAALRNRGVQPMSVGRIIVATWEPHETTVLRAIRDFGLELQVIFNKGAVMVLPAGVNKASGLRAALARMGLSARNAVGVGDAENDHALLGMCECGVAVSNALPTLKDAADWVTTADHGAGVAELADEIVLNDLASRVPLLTRHRITVGWDANGDEIRVPPYGETILIAADAPTSGPLQNALLARVRDRGYTFCVVDPSGTQEAPQGTVVLGSAQRPPALDDALKLLANPSDNAVLNTSAVAESERYGFFESLWLRLQRASEQIGLPHWLVLNEAQRLPTLPSYGSSTPQTVLQIMTPPSTLPAKTLAQVDLLLITGKDARRKLEDFSRATGTPLPENTPRGDPDAGELWAWRPRVSQAPVVQLTLAAPASVTKVHSRKAHV
ncbi:MAG TPA: HAD family hydrolase [Steroidobacteraceae bacterium]|nr:HAD family hydrolase [Steroidobacteraceae bacterium]